MRFVCFNICQHGHQILYSKLHVDGRKFHYRRPHAAVVCALLPLFNLTLTLTLNPNANPTVLKKEKEKSPR